MARKEEPPPAWWEDRSRTRRVVHAGDEARTSPLLTEPLLVVAVLSLGALGALNLLSLGERAAAARQVLLLAVGLAVMAVVAHGRGPDRRWLGRSTYVAGVLMLLAVVLTATRVYGARRWLGVGSLVLQPSELVKVGLLLVLAEVLADPTRRRRLVLALALLAVPLGLTLLEPDLSTAALLGLGAAAVLVLARIRIRHLVTLAALAAALVPVALHLLRPYQVARLHAFLDGGADVQGTGWSILQAHIAIAAGGLQGVSTLPHNLLATYLPARDTDLAFASLVEQHGLVAGALVLAAAMLLVWRLAASAIRARSTAGALVAAGLGVLVGAETLVNIGGNLGILPLAGVPCPFLSSGGTAAVAHLVAVGVVLGDIREAQVRALWRPPRSRRRRPRLSRTAALALSGALVVLGLSAAQLQRDQGAALRAAALEQVTRTVVLYAPRGTIVDRHGAVLSVDTGESRVLAVPDLVSGAPQGPERLAAALGTTVAQVRAALHGRADGWAVTVAGAVPAPVAQRVEAAAIPGVLVDSADHRRYPTGSLLAPVVGFAGVATPDDVARLGTLPPREIVGRSGLEQQYDATLRGRDGEQRILVDAGGHAVALGGAREPAPGDELVTSLDLGLQRDATSALAGALRGVRGQPRGDQGTVVVMDAHTGELLALASLPSYDDNTFGPPVDVGALFRLTGTAGDPILEHATQTQAPPGSTFKLVVAAADTVFRAVPPQQVIPTGGAFRYGGVVFHSWASLPPQNLPQAIAWSNDVYFYKLALALGPDRIAQVASALGVGRPTGVDLPGESAGLLGTPAAYAALGRTWYAGMSVILGIGQGAVTATPLQVARWTAAVSSGALVVPHLGLADATAGAAAATPVTVPPAAPLPFAASLGPVRDGLRRAVTEGTGTMLRTLPVAAGGKTGTAEDPTSPSGGADAWFTAVAPVSNPDVVVTVLVRGGGEGYYTSEPVAAQVLAYYLAHRDAIRATLPVAGRGPQPAAPTSAPATRVSPAPVPAAPAAGRRTIAQTVAMRERRRASRRPAGAAARAVPTTRRRRGPSTSRAGWRRPRRRRSADGRHGAR